MLFVGDVWWTCLDVSGVGMKDWMYGSVFGGRAGSRLTSEESDGGHNERQRLERDICKSPRNMKYNN